MEQIIDWVSGSEHVTNLLLITSGGFLLLGGGTNGSEVRNDFLRVLSLTGTRLSAEDR